MRGSLSGLADGMGKACHRGLTHSRTGWRRLSSSAARWGPHSSSAQGWGGGKGLHPRRCPTGPGREAGKAAAAGEFLPPRVSASPLANLSLPHALQPPSMGPGQGPAARQRVSRDAGLLRQSLNEWLSTRAGATISCWLLRLPGSIPRSSGCESLAKAREPAFLTRGSNRSVLPWTWRGVPCWVAINKCPSHGGA